jgi:hypothetical protein
MLMVLYRLKVVRASEALSNLERLEWREGSREYRGPEELWKYRRP